MKKAEPTASTENADQKPVRVLVLGHDSRGDLPPNEWAVGEQRSDVVMLAQITGDRQAASVLSFPRDAWVEIPGHGQHKINAAYSLGGPDLAKATVEQLVGVPIDHVLVTNFDGFAGLVDAL